MTHMCKPPLVKGGSTLTSQVTPIFLIQGWFTLTRRRLEFAEGCSTLVDASRPTLTVTTASSLRLIYM